MKTRTIYLIAFYFFSLTVYASAANDTTLYCLPEIEIKSSRILSQTGLKYNSQIYIDAEEIRNSPAPQIDAILNLSSGIHIKNYGGLGGVKTVSIRGFSGSQTLFLLDGMKLNSSQSGMVDISILPSNLIESIEIAKSGSSAIYGGNAMSGIVNFNTTTFVKKNELHLGIGSFGEYSISAMSSSSISKYDYTLFSSYLTSSGDYSFVKHEYGKEIQNVRLNADFNSKNVFAAISGPLLSLNLKSKFLYMNSRRGVPGFVVQNYTENSQARYDEDQAVFILSADKLFSSSSIFLGSILRYNNSKYKDPLAFAYGSEGLDQNFINADLQIAGEFKKVFNKLSIISRIEAGYSSLSGILQPGIGNKAERYYLGISLQNDYHFLETKAVSSSFFTALRYDFFNDAGSSISPIAGIYFKLPPSDLTVKTQWSYNFRPPNFNELYYLNYGSADLESEKCNSLNTGIMWNPVSYFYIQADFFASFTENLIVSVPKTPVLWSAQNIGKVFGRGLELSAFVKINSLITIKPAYTFQKSTDETNYSVVKGKEIVYTPKEILSIPVIINYKNFNFGSFFNYTSFRFTLPDNSFNSIIKDYFTVDISSAYSFTIFEHKLKLIMNVMNLLDKRYEVIINYPMPGRTFRGGMNFEF